jgi:hypothetical protein
MDRPGFRTGDHPCNPAPRTALIGRCNDCATERRYTILIVVILLIITIDHTISGRNTAFWVGGVIAGYVAVGVGFNFDMGFPLELSTDGHMVPSLV